MEALIYCEKKIDIFEKIGRLEEYKEILYKNFEYINKFDKITIQIYPRNFKRISNKLNELGFNLKETVWESNSEEYWKPGRYVYIKEE